MISVSSESPPNLQTRVEMKTAGAVETAVADVLEAGLRTADIAAGGSAVSTREMGDAVARQLRDGQS